MGRYPVVLPHPGLSLFSAFALLAFTFTPFATAPAAAEGPEIALLVGEGGSDYKKAQATLYGAPDPRH